VHGVLQHQVSSVHDPQLLHKHMQRMLQQLATPTYNYTRRHLPSTSSRNNNNSTPRLSPP
jgi:hypothetical protein